MKMEKLFEKIYNSSNIKKYKEYGLTQDQFNSLANSRSDFDARTSISPREKNNLFSDIKDFEQEFKDLKRTAERLPDEYIDKVCDYSSYPFDDVLDEVQDVENWCLEAEEFLKDDINSWGVTKKRN